MPSFEDEARKAIPCEVHMISGSMDSQTSSDVFNVGNFQLPDPAGKAGGACTSALLKVLYDPSNQQGVTWVSALEQMRSFLRQKDFDQIPQLTSSRMVDVNKPLEIVPSPSGTKRAVLIGINYVGQKGQLRGCHNDVDNMKKFLIEKQGFSEQNMVILMDDGKHTSPTKKNILNAFQQVAEQSSSGDVVFVHYSGHGGRIKDQNSDEDDGNDETLIPLDFQQAGHIRDDDVLRVLVSPMPVGVTLTCVMDSCHSGTVLDLPYRFTSSGTKMQRNEKYKAKRASAFRCLNIMNLLAYIANAAVTYGIGTLAIVPGTSDNATLSAKYQTLVTPVGWAFSIWAVIFILELMWSIIQLFPAYRGSSLVRRGVGWYWIGVCMTQIGWTAAFSFEIIWLSLVAMLSILVFLLLIVVAQYRVKMKVSLRDYVLLKLPFLIHAGWILAASIVNINVLLVSLQLSAEILYYTALASLLVILGIALVCLFYPARKDLTIPFVLVWATAGIYVELQNPMDVIVQTFESPLYILAVQYGAIGVCGLVLFLSLFVGIWNCRSIGADLRKNGSTEMTSLAPGGDYVNMGEV
jgi:hypothetical protein